MRYRKYSQHHEVRNRAILDARARRKRRDFFMFLVIAAFVVGPLLTYVGFRMERHQIRRGIENMQREIHLLREETRLLQAEKIRLESLGRVEQTARGALGMTDARPEDIVLVLTRTAPAISGRRESHTEEAP